MISISNFTRLHGVPVTVTQLCHCAAEAAGDNIPTNEYGCTPTKFYLQEQMEARIGPRTAACRPLLCAPLSFRELTFKGPPMAGRQCRTSSITSQLASKPTLR